MTRCCLLTYGWLVDKTLYKLTRATRPFVTNAIPLADLLTHISGPVIVEDYNAKMAGCRSEPPSSNAAFLCLYASHKSLTWYHAVYHWIRLLALTNGYVLYKLDKADGCLDPAEFRKQVVDYLQSEYVPTEQRSSGRPSSKPIPDRPDATFQTLMIGNQTVKCAAIVRRSSITSVTLSLLQAVRLTHACCWPDTRHWEKTLREYRKFADNEYEWLFLPTT